MSEELTAESFFGEEKPKEEKTAVFNEAIKNSVPDGVKNDSVCEVRFCTGGRLSAPSILHFHDYNMRASQSIAEIPNASEHLPLVIDILNSMVVEDFDCGLLHIEEVKEVLMNVHAKWWGSKLSGYRYLIDDTIEDKEKLFAKENISIAEIPIGNIVVKPLAPNIKEPINISTDGSCVRFIYPRVQNSVIVANLLKKEFAVEEQEFFEVRQKINWNKNQTDPANKKELTLEESEAYRDFLARKEEADLLYTRAQLICAIDDKVLNTFEERVDALKNSPKVTLKHWMLYNDFLKKEGDFGVQEKVKFYSDILNKEIERSFPFRTYNFFPSVSVESIRSEQSQISFG